MAGRKTDLTSSCYVTGNISAKHRDRWVEASKDLSVSDLPKMDDEELGLTLKACTRIRTNVKNALNKLNQQGGRGSWSRHMTEQKAVLVDQVGIVDAIHKALTFEADKREREAEPMIVVDSLGGTLTDEERQDRDAVLRKAMDGVPDFAKPVLRPSILAPGKEPVQAVEFHIDKNRPGEKFAKVDMSELEVRAVAEKIQNGEPLPDVGSKTVDVDCSLYSMLKDVTLQEILEFARQGLEGSKAPDLSAELAAAEKDNAEQRARIAALEENVEGLKNSYDELKERNTTLYAENKELKAKNKKLNNVKTELDNMHNRLKNLTV